MFIKYAFSRIKFKIYILKNKKVITEKITTQWGRVEKTKGTYQLKNETWQGEKEEALPDDLDEFDVVYIYEQICE